MYWDILITGFIVDCILYKRFKKRIWTDKGVIGEADVHREIRKLPGHKKTLTNCYIPTDEGTTEVDVIMINELGIFVIESKNYSGIICGNEDDRMWTEVFPVYRYDHRDFDFYNPIMQNETHIKWLKAILELDDSTPIYSIVLFSNDCELRNIKILAPNVYVGYQVWLKHIFRDIVHMNESRLTKDDIKSIYRQLEPYTHVSEKEREAHIERIKNKLKTNGKAEKCPTASPTSKPSTNS